MKILLGIIFFHLLVIVRARMRPNGGMPYISILLITICLVGYVVLMMFLMEVPQG